MNQGFCITCLKAQDADAFLHLGDSEFQYNDTELSLYHRVKGNCDFYPEFPEEEIIEEEGMKAFTHMDILRCQSYAYETC